MPTIEIRPRRATEIVDASFQLLRRFYPQLLTVSAIAMAPGVFLRIVERDKLSNPTAMMAHPGSWMGVALVGWLSLIVADGVLTVAVSDGYLGGDVDLGRAFGAGMRALGSVLVATILRSFLVGSIIAVITAIAAMFVAVHVGAVLLLIVPLGLWLFVYLLLRTFATTAAVLLENTGAQHAIQRSWRLSRDCTAHIFFSLGLAFLLYFVISAIVSTLGVTLLTQSTAGIIGAVLIIPIYPLFAVVSTLLYYDLRIRKEGFDLELMSRELGGAPAPLPAA